MNTKHRFFYIIALVALLMAFVLPCTAQASGVDLARVKTGERLPRFIDNKSLLTPTQASELTAKLDEISARHKFDTVVAVVDTLDARTARLYAIDFFEQNGFGFGKDLDGIILLLAMEDRDFGLAATGYGTFAFSDTGQEYLEKLFLPHLKGNKYFEAFMAYADGVDEFLPKVKARYRVWSAVVSLIIALIITLIVTLSWKYQLKSVRKENLAGAYIIQGSMAVTRSRDIFLHRSVSKTARPKNDSSGSGGFKSSSGRSSSGRSGKF
ncbi:MAG: TPM domain-containing protein [Synergistaceae bacterium]|nr:TPM domain-containing protein [Synergistaceae bacterium]